MAFDQSTRNRLQKFVSSARAILSEEFTRQLQATYGLDPKLGTNAPIKSLTHLDNRQRQTAHLLRETLAHYLATTPGKTEKDRIKQVLDRIVREQAFTVLNRLAALRMAEARGFLLESIAKGHNSQGFKLYRFASATAHGETGDAYRNYLFSLFDEFSLDLAVLFDRHSAQGRLFPRESALLELLGEINHVDIEHLWAEDETIGWIYQYFNSQEERKKMRAESQAPRNSRELAVRNQFFTPRYVVEFLTDNTLGRIWYEMTQGNTGLVDSCRYLVRRPTEIFLKPGEDAPETEQNDEALSQEELLKQPVYIPHRPLKDPRTIRMLDPACGSMHFGLYAFDLFERIYLEAWQLEQQLGAATFTREDGLTSLQETYASLDAFKQQIPKLIIEHNIHGVDIDPRAVQIAGLSLWQRAQRAWYQQGIKPQQRPTIVKSNIVCAEPMPGEKALLQEFTSKLNPPVLGQLLEVIFDKMQLAGEAGTLLKIEEEIQTAIHEAREQWLKQSGSRGTSDLFQAELDVAIPQTTLGFDLRGINDESFWDDAEFRILQALSDYAEQAEATADQKRLFAEDAAKGFAFIDLCRKRFDVVLMNPPFGQGATKTKNLLEQYYPDEKAEVAACFISRGRRLGTQNGKLGCLATRLLLSLPSYEKWRVREFLSTSSLTLTADLGFGVLDAAVVEAAAYIQNFNSTKNGFFIDCLQRTDKEKALIESISNPIEIKCLPLKLFAFLPASVIAHFVDLKTIKNIAKSKSLIEAGVRAYKGINTSDDFRFLRLSWENMHAEKDEIWKKFAKGGEWSPFWDDVHLEVNWRGSGEEILLAGGTVRNPETQLRHGLTYPERTTSSFGPRILPHGTVYSSAGMGIFASDNSLLLCYLPLLLSRQGQYLIELSLSGGDSSVSGTAARHYTNGMINRLPMPKLEGDQLTLEELSVTIIGLKRQCFSTDETSREFDPDIGNLVDVEHFAKHLLLEKIENLLKQCSVFRKLDAIISPLFGLPEEEISVVVGKNVWHYSASCEDHLVKDLYSLDESRLVDRAKEVLGGARFVTKNSQLLDRKIELISHITSCSPEDVLCSLKASLNELVDAPLLMKCALRIVSSVFGTVFQKFCFESSVGNNTFFVNEKVKCFDGPGIIGIDFHEKQTSTFEAHFDEILAEKFENLSISALSDYLNVKDLSELSSVFFEHHLSEYSKSRRQAPIYWFLQSQYGSYSFWFYYHRLNEQTLYSCINDYVEPKIQQVEQELNILHNKSARNSSEEKSLEKLSNLISELRDFRDELLRIAKFWKPNLNDGVQITAAPLWKLFQHKAWQKKLKETWESLEQGEYDWAHLACSIWPERVLRKCHQDRSLAIAHDVEDHFWHEVEVPVTRSKKATGETKFEWQPRDLSESELNALVKKLAAERG